MNPQERQGKLQSYGQAWQALVEGLEQFPREMWHFRDEHGCWSIHEHVVHITDSEANSYIRCRRLVAEPGESLMAYDENVWAQKLDYHAIDTEGAIDLFRALRRQTHALLQGLPESAWANVCFHPENGDMTLDDWLDVYERHVAEHLSYMRESYEAWLKTKA